MTTASASAIGFYDATSGGAIADNGGCAITQKGVAWSWASNPTIGNPQTMQGAGDASFVSSIAPLYANRTYYVRAYATNSVGTTYGQQVVFTTAEPTAPYIGRSYAGGIVFYVDGSGEHGLVVAPTDLGTMTWGCQGTSVPTSTAFGSGPTNTAAIVASCGEANFAAKAADSLVLNLYSDWFLPSFDELLLARNNLFAQGLGGFSDRDYWTSSEAGSSYAYEMWFYNPTYYTTQKSRDYIVRAVRAF